MGMAEGSDDQPARAPSWTRHARRLRCCGGGAGVGDDLRTPHIEGNQCTSCHRVGTGTIDIFNLLGQIDVNDLMPPSAPGTMPDEVEALQQCWESGPDDATGCEWVNPPGAYCD